jgi:hypothetical protein
VDAIGFKRLLRFFNNRFLIIDRNSLYFTLTNHPK